MLARMLAKARNQEVPKKFNGAPCAYFDGVFDYFNINEVAYHAKFDGMKWNGPCVISYSSLGLKYNLQHRFIRINAIIQNTVV